MRAEGDSKAGQAKVRGVGFGEPGEDTMKEREFVGHTPRRGISREESQS